MRRSGNHCRGAEDGAAAVEFALLLPLLVALLFGFIQFGLAFNNKIQATNAAREGARIAVVGIDDWRNVNGSGKTFWKVVQDRAGGIAISNCQVTPMSGFLNGNELTVEFDYPVQLVIPFVPLPASWNHGHAKAVMRIEESSPDVPAAGCFFT